MLTTAERMPEEQDFTRSSLSPGATQKRLAVALVIGLLVVFVLITAVYRSIFTGRRRQP